MLCELANSCTAAGRLDEAIGYGEKGLDPQSPDFPFCATVLGNAYDGKGDLAKGEATFRRGLEVSPHGAMLHFNLGVNLVQQKKLPGAVPEFQAAITGKFDYAGSWRALAVAHQSLGARGAAFEEFARFLTLEPDSKRSPDAAKQLSALLYQGTEQVASEKDPSKSEINITIPPPKGEDVRASALALAMSAVAMTRRSNDWRDKSNPAFFAHAFESILTVFEETLAKDKKPDPFEIDHVMPYFSEARRAGHLEAMAYDIMRSSGDAITGRWLQEHATAVADYRAWSSAWTPPTE